MWGWILLLVIVAAGAYYLWSRNIQSVTQLQTTVKEDVAGLKKKISPGKKSTPEPAPQDTLFADEGVPMGSYAGRHLRKHGSHGRRF